MRCEVKTLIATAGAMGYWVMLILVDIMDGNAGNIISSWLLELAGSIVCDRGADCTLAAAKWPRIRVSVEPRGHGRELEDYGSMARKITNLFWTNFAGSRLPGGAVGRGLSVN